jgi:hypothetical protein
MGTRGLYGFRKGGVDKLTYNHYDSYPDGLGSWILKFIKDTSIDKMNEIFDRIIMVKGDDKPTSEQIEECKPCTDLDVSTKSINDWYCLLKKAQGDLGYYGAGIKYMIDNHDFIKDSECEYAYIINLDNNILEFYVGYQKEPDVNGRYGCEYDELGYYPCKLITEYMIDFKLNIENVIKDMTVSADSEYEGFTEDEELSEELQEECERNADRIIEKIEATELIDDKDLLHIIKVTWKNNKIIKVSKTQITKDKLYLNLDTEVDVETFVFDDIDQAVMFFRSQVEKMAKV